jgi:hypothetical protein
MNIVLEDVMGQNSTSLRDEQIGLGKLIRNGTLILSAAFLTASLGFHYLSTRSDNEMKSLPTIANSVRQQNTSNIQFALAGFGIFLGAITGVAQFGLRKLHAEANTTDFRP